MKDLYAKMTFRLVLISFLALMLIGCGESGSPGGGSGPGQTAAISLSLQNNTLPADGNSSTAMTILLSDSSGNAVEEGTRVNLRTTLGTFSNGKKEYRISTPDDSGVLTVSLIAENLTGDGIITAESNKVTQTTKISFTESENKTPVFLSLGASTNTVKSDNSDSAIITAVVLDADRAPIKGITVFFSTVAEDGTAGAGQISASSLVTDENGEAEVQFSAGVGDKRNQIVTIEATVDGIGSKQIPIQVTGSYLTVSAEGETNLQVGGETSRLKVAVYDAGNKPVFAAPVNLSLSTDSTGVVGIDPVSGQTDINGEFTANIAGIGNGTATVQVEALGAMGLQSYTIDDPNKLFRIIKPTSNLVGLSTGEDLIVQVTSPGYDRVVFGTTIGGWDNGASKVIEKSVVNGQAIAVFSAEDAGTATIQAYPASDPTVTDSIKIAISAPSSEAAKILFQSTASVVAPSTQDVKNSVTLIAKVTNSRNQIVKGAAVLFGIENPTGGGEYVSPAIAFSDESGIVTSVFTSGSLVAGAEGVEVTAELINNGASDSVSIVISGQAASVVIGRSTEIESINEGTSYQLPMSLLVTDANGSPVNQASVSLNLWPSQYSVGVWVPRWTAVNEECYPVYEETRNNEDVNRNLILDEGEDINQDGQLTPPLPAAGSIPDILVTDENGVANFYLVYLKSSAAWIKDEITATTVVSGTETASTYRLTLPWSIPDAEDCLLPDSPYFIEVEEPEVASINVTAGIGSIVADGSATTTIRANVLGTDNEPMSGQDVVFTTTLGDFIGEATVKTNNFGVAVITLRSETAPGTAIVTANADGFTDQVEVIMTASAPAILSLAAIPNPVVPNGQAAVVATIKDRFGNPVAGEQINFQIEINRTGGSISSSAETSDVNGQATLIYTASDILGTDRIKATLNNNQSITRTSDITVKWANFAVGSISLQAGNTSIPADGNSSTAITATILDTSGNPVPEGTTCVFTTTLGSFNGLKMTSRSTTDNSGILITSLTADYESGNAVVTARCGGVTQTINIEIEGGGVVPVVGSISLESQSESIPSDGASSTAITATVLDTTGNPVPKGTQVTFSTTLGTFPRGISGTGTITSRVTITTAGEDGNAITSLVSGNKPGQAIVSATVPGSGLTQSITVLFTGGSVANIQLVAEKSVLKANGVDQTIITALVKTADNQAIEGELVSFSTTGGTITTPFITDVNGKAIATLTSGQYNGEAVITARAQAGAQATTRVIFQGITLSLSADPIVSFYDQLNPEPVEIKAFLNDAEGRPIEGETINLELFSYFPDDPPPSNPPSVIGSFIDGFSYVTDIFGNMTAYLMPNQAGTIYIKGSSEVLGTTGSDVVEVVFNQYQMILSVTPGTIRVHETAEITASLTENGVPKNNVTVIFSTSIGSLIGGTSDVSGAGMNLPGEATTILQAGNQSGKVTLNAVAVIDGQELKAATEMRIAGGNASKIILKANPEVISTRTGTATITANMYDINDQPAGNQKIYFRIADGPGGGEYLTLSETTTDALTGRASVQLIAGGIPGATIGDVKIEASSDPDFIGVIGQTSLTIAGPVAQISVGINLEDVQTQIEDGHIEVGVSGIATDVNGNPVADGTQINFSVRSIAFDEDRDSDGVIHCRRYNGLPCDGTENILDLGITWFSDDVNQDGTMYSLGGVMAPSEDKNSNGILDSGEDLNGNGVMDPPQGVTIDNPKITTNGIATTAMYYPMSYADNVKVRITAEAGGITNFYDIILLCTEKMVQSGTCGLGY